MLEWEHAVYAACFAGPDREELCRLLSMQLHNKGYMRTDEAIIKYRVHGSRMSGDMNTSLGNCLIMCALVWTICKERGILCRLANNGDDCVVFVEKRDQQRLSVGLREWFWEFGFNMKVEPAVDVFERIEFCQAHPVWDGYVWLMVRNPVTSVSKDGCAIVRDFGHGQGARKWLGAVGECGLRLTGGVPVVQDYYVAFLRHGDGKLGNCPAVHETGMYMLAKNMQRGYAVPTEDARYSFYLAFGICATHQVELEEHMRTIQFAVPKSPCIGHTGAGEIPL
jgi:hypothetical protein